MGVAAAAVLAATDDGSQMAVPPADAPRLPAVIEQGCRPPTQREWRTGRWPRCTATLPDGRIVRIGNAAIRTWKPGDRATVIEVKRLPMRTIHIFQDPA